MNGKNILGNVRHEHRVLGDERGQLIAIESGERLVVGIYLKALNEILRRKRCV
jgi:hypothetical protein